jgi:hypothetical protein
MDKNYSQSGYLAFGEMLESNKIDKVTKGG